MKSINSSDIDAKMAAVSKSRKSIDHKLSRMILISARIYSTYFSECQCKYVGVYGTLGTGHFCLCLESEKTAGKISGLQNVSFI